MSPKKQYQRRLPTILPPAPRQPSELETTPSPPAVPEAPPQPEPRPAPRPEPVPEPDPLARPATSASGPARPTLRVIVLVVLVVCGVGAVWGLTHLLADGPDRSDPPAVPDAAGWGTTRENYVEAQVRPDGAVVVRQWIRSDDPLRRLVLAVPTLPDGAPVSARRLQVVADGVPVDGVRRIGAAGATFDLEDASTVRLAYVLRGTVQVSAPETGRALVLSTSLEVSYGPRPEQETRAVLAPTVLSLACAPQGSDVLEPCGTQSGGRWTVELTGDRTGDRVAAVVDLR